MSDMNSITNAAINGWDKVAPWLLVFMGGVLAGGLLCNGLSN